MYCRLRITWERFSASSIRRPTPEVSTVGFWAAPGRTARAPSSASAAARHTRFTGETLGGWSCLKVRGGRGVCLTRGSLLLVAALPRDRQRDGHGGADPDRRIDGDAPAEHVPHDAVHDHEAHPASLAKLLRREPGLEDAVEILGEDAAPLVLHRELERLARALHADPDGRRALGAGVGGIADQVHEHVIQGVRVPLQVDRIDRGVELQRSEEHTSELQSLAYLVCRLLLEKKITDV